MEPAGDSEEGRLVERAKSGDAEALRILLELQEARLRRRLDRGIPPPLRRKVSAADVMQETWLVAFRRIDEFENRGEGAFGAWLGAIADLKLREAVRRHLAAAKRSAGREVTRGGRPSTSAHVDPGPGPSELAAAEELRRRAERVFEGLPDDYREVLELVQIRGMTLKDAAARMGRSYEAVKKLYGRAVSRYAKELRP